MIELAELQRQAIATSAESPPIVVDPGTNATYVLVRKEFYDQFRVALDDDDPRLMAPLLADLDAEDWEDASTYKGTP